MKRIPCSDWLPERERWSYLANNCQLIFPNYAENKEVWYPNVLTTNMQMINDSKNTRIPATMRIIIHRSMDLSSSVEVVVGGDGVVVASFSLT